MTKFLLLALLLLQVPKSFAIQAKLIHYDKETKLLIADAWESFKTADYKKVIIDAEEIERHLRDINITDTKILGLLFYWKAISYKNLQDYVQAMNYFRKAIGYQYDGKDLFYEYAQVLYASEQLKKARAAFALSIKNKYKVGVSYYYIGNISTTMSEYKLALKAYHKIEKLPVEEKNPILQPTLVQIGDIYYMFAKDKENLLESIEEFVIPQYEKAVRVAPFSNLSIEIKRKIRNIQTLFEIEFFKMRNGRNVIFPKNFVRLSAGGNYDTNVTLASNESQSTQTDIGSPYFKTGFFARKSLYPNKQFIFIPEFRFDYTHYTNSATKIKVNNGYTMGYALRNTIEHSWENAPASFLYEWDYSTTKRDEGSDGTLDPYTSSSSFIFGERFNFLKWGESVLKYKYKTSTFEDTTSNSTTHTISYEQVFRFKKGYTVLGYSSFDTAKVNNSDFDSDAYTFKADVVFPRASTDKIWSASFTLLITNPVNQKDDRGLETSYIPGVTYSKIYNKNFRGNWNYSFTMNNSKSEDYSYNKHALGYNLEYIY